MSLDSLLPDSLRLTADLAAQFALEHPETFRDFLDASLAQEYPMALRASRVVYLCAVARPGLVRPHLDEMLGSLAYLHDASVIRNFLHVFDDFVAELTEEQLGHLLKYCFDHIEDPAQTIAIRTYSLKLLYIISQRVPELKPELISIIHHHLPESPPAFQAQSAQIIKNLEKEILKNP
jgi:hypothetical protein